VTTAVADGVGVSIREAADAMGISPNAVRMRIRHRTVNAYKDGDQWRVVLGGIGTEGGWSPTSDQRSKPTSPPMSIETDQPPVSPVAQAQFAAVIREAVAPFIEELGSVHRRLGATEQELIQEREQRGRIERDYEAARRELAALKMIVRARDHKRADSSPESTEADPAAIAQTHENTAPDPPPREPGASEPARRRGWFARLFLGKTKRRR
jgi:hypothetical protein